MNENQYPNNYNGQGYYNQQPQGGYNNQYYQPAPGGYPPPQNNNQNNGGGVPMWVKILMPAVVAVCLTIVILVLTGVIGPKVSNDPVPAESQTSESQQSTAAPVQQPATTIVYVPVQPSEPSTVYVPVQSGYYAPGRYKVTGVGNNVLYIRTGPGQGYSTVSYAYFHQNAKDQIYKLRGLTNANGLVNGVVCDVTQVSGDWGRIPSGWINLRYCTKIG